MTLSKARAIALQEGLQKLRWTVGRDIQVDYRYAAGNAERMRDYANEAVASGPDLLLAQTNPALQALQKATRTSCRSCFSRFRTLSADASFKVSRIREVTSPGSPISKAK